jgi:outer membrane lipoprotein SlyB
MLNRSRSLLAAAAALAALSLEPSIALAQQPPRPIPSQCPNCGVVERVVPVQRQGQAKGIAGTGVTPGMAIGGVVGGLLGNQLGGGRGRTATTVVGAAGGAYAGHAIEKNRARTTAYVLHIRMADGSMRTVEQRQPFDRGAHVVVENGHARRV